MNTRHHVTFRFGLPGALALHAPVGYWMPAPRGVTVDVGEDGDVLVISLDHSETYARNQVLTTAAHFLRAIAGLGGPLTFIGELSAPSCRPRSETYSISVGASVSIARSDPHRAPVITLGPRQLDLLNRASG